MIPSCLLSIKTDDQYFKMQGSSFRKTSAPRVLMGLQINKIKRIHHIKSLPAFQLDSLRKYSFSKVEVRSKDEHQTKLKRFKTHQNLKPLHFGAVKTARDRTFQLARRKQQPSQASKSLTKSTTYRSPFDERERRRDLKCSKSRSKKSIKKLYTSIINRVKQVMQEYQLKLVRYKQQKQEMSKQNLKLKAQLDCLNKRVKKIDK